MFLNKPVYKDILIRPEEGSVWVNGQKYACRTHIAYSYLDGELAALEIDINLLDDDDTINLLNDDEL